MGLGVILLDIMTKVEHMTNIELALCVSLIHGSEVKFHGLGIILRATIAAVMHIPDGDQSFRIPIDCCSVVPLLGGNRALSHTVTSLVNFANTALSLPVSAIGGSQGPVRGLDKVPHDSVVQ